MPVLKNPKQERAVQELIGGKNETDAYEAAGYKRDTGNAAKFFSKPAIKARVAELTGAVTEQVVKATGITVERVLAELEKLAFANMLDFIQINADGVPYTDFSELTPQQAAAIHKIFVETTTAYEGEGDDRVPTEVRKVRFELYDKRAALVDIGRHLGMFKQIIEHAGKDGGPIEVKDVSARELIQRRIASIAARTGPKEDPPKPD